MEEESEKQKLILQIEKIVEMEQSSSNDLQSLMNSFLTFTKCTESLFVFGDNPLFTELALHEYIDDDGRDIICGSTGSFKNLIAQFSTNLNLFFEYYREFVKETTNMISIKSIESLDKNKTSVQKSISNLTNESTKLENLQEMLKSLSPEANDNQSALKTIKEVNDFAEKSATKAKLGFTETKKPKKYFQSIQSLREPLKLNRMTLLQTGVKSQQSIISSLQPIREDLENKIETVQTITAELKKNLSKLTAKIREIAEETRNNTNDLNFHNDFSTFVKQHRIIRYDLLCEPFRPIDTSHPAFQDINTNISIAVPPVYPVGLAKIVTSYFATEKNEMSIAQGKYLLLMETIDPNEKWVLGLNPTTHSTGFVPVECLEQIGASMGVFFLEPPTEQLPENIHINKGDYCAILNDNGASYKVCTTKGDEFDVVKEIIGVIYN